MKINENTLAKQVAQEEGLKTSLSIGQIKEVIRVMLDTLADCYEMSEIVALIEKHSG